MLRKIYPLFLLVFCLLLPGCGQKAALQNMAPKEDDAMARQFLELLRTGDYAAADRMIDPSLQGEKGAQGLRELGALLARGKQLSIEIVGVWLHSSTSLKQTEKLTVLSYQIRYADTWLAGDIRIRHVDGHTAIIRAYFNILPDSLESINRFTFSGKGIIHYLVFVIVIAVPVFIIFTLVVCVRSPIRRKWLWIIFVLVGVMNFQFSWTTGQWDWRLIYISMFGTGVARASPYAAWIFNFGIPIGAIVFLSMRRRLIASNIVVPPAVTPPPLLGSENEKNDESDQ